MADTSITVCIRASAISALSLRAVSGDGCLAAIFEVPPLPLFWAKVSNSKEMSADFSAWSQHRTCSEFCAAKGFLHTSIDAQNALWTTPPKLNAVTLTKLAIYAPVLGFTQ